VTALQKIKAAQAPVCVARRQSGTHFAELQLWKAAGDRHRQGQGPWYRAHRLRHGPTLNTAAGMNAYALTDRGTWLSFKNRADLVISVEAISACSTSTA